MARMTTSEIEAAVKAAQHNSVGVLGSSISQHRANLMDRYNGEPYGDEVADRSQVVMSDVRDVVESIKPELMEIFFGGDKVVSFAPRGRGDVDAAEQETEVCNYLIQQKNDGFLTFYGWFHDALALKNGYIKRFWDEREITEIEEYDHLSMEDAQRVLAGMDEDADAVEIIEQWENTAPVDDPMTGAPAVDPISGEPIEAVESIGFKVRLSRKLEEYRIVNVPPDEVVVASMWTRLDFEGCPYVAHRSVKPASYWIEMGFDRKSIEALGTHDRRYDSEEAAARWDRHEDFETTRSPADESMRDVLVFENYIRIDRDGDGVAELLQVFTGDDGTVLKRRGKAAIEPVDAAPFNTLSSVPDVHKHYGTCVAELVTDLQRIRTVLTRQMLDNVVMSNNADMVADLDAMTEETYADLQITRAGRTIRIPGGMGSIGPMAAPNTAAQSLAALEFIEGVKESRTGVTRYNQGLDADSLNQTASGMKTIMRAAEKKILLIARIFAETGVRRLFLDMHRDLRRGPLRKLSMLLRNEWVDVDPRMWRTRSDMTINVGLGTGDRDRQFQRLGMVLDQQKEGLSAGLVGYQHIHHTLSRMLELSGFQDVERFFPEPEEVAQRQQQAAQEPQEPDPNMAIAMVEREKANLQAQTKAAELAAQREKNAADVQLREFDLRIKMAEMESRRLEVLMKDDRERDLAAAKIEADEAARRGMPVDGPALTSNE